ncbi:BON domain-containing protein [Aquabacter spiritensis]|uniref:BON domain-containing protein n=1 Tax=Aquabacter spiritensis TaxID=933073 RepID=A0A4R3M494_9HYPH|nr:BON domain-containing protein [Aquabacter spiritensis]TCT08101.1 BON domain-containing protein [Aquabacter spiritensis]
MAQNWRNDEHRARDHEQDDRSNWRDDRSYRSGQTHSADQDHSGYGRDRGYRDEQGRGSDYQSGRPTLSRSPSYGSDAGASSARGSWSGMEGDRTEDRFEGSRSEYGRGRDAYGASDPDRYYGSGSYPPSGFGYGRSGGRDEGRRGRPDWGRQEWGMSGPQQSDWERDQRNDRGFWDRASDEVSSWFGDEAAERRRREDEHRGRGPKNYARSDDRVREDVNDRLTDDGLVDASEIEVSVAKGEVTLTGVVADRRQRRRAEDVAEQVSGVQHVQNNVRVRGTGTTPGSTASQSDPTGAAGKQTAITPGQSSTISSRNT